jgi:gluconokinase
MIIIITGVAGSGKTTIGTLLASQLNWPFFDADEFHPQSNIDKMSQGIPLTDDDRWPWLDAIRIKAQSLTDQNQSGVFTCSALKHIYRKRLRQDGVTMNFVYLKGNYALIEERMKQRQHFMKPGMLASQFETLEEPHDALVIDISQSPEECVAEIRERLSI